MQTINRIELTKSFKSPLEKKLYYAFNKWGLFPKPNYLVGKFEIDLAFPEQMIAIEIDGQAYHSTSEQRARDKFRQEILEKKGWKFERVDGWFANRHSEILIAKIILKYFSPNEQTRQRAQIKISQYFREIDPELSQRLFKVVEL